MSGFEDVGFEVVDDLVDSNWSELVTSNLPSVAGSGSRTLLSNSVVRAKAAELREDPKLSRFLKALVAVQCTLFRKTIEHNWSIRLHRDALIPLRGTGPWPAAGTKESALTF